LLEPWWVLIPDIGLSNTKIYNFVATVSIEKLNK